MTKHGFHMVDPSPWPFTCSVGVWMLLSMMWMMLKNSVNPVMLMVALVLLAATIIQWWRDVTREASFSGKHTSMVQQGLRYGMLLFILSEVMLFVSFFWAFFHSSLSPNVEIGSLWPPMGIEPVNPFHLPLLNTAILLTSGATITWTHMSMIEGDWASSMSSLFITVVLGLYFSALQLSEYYVVSFAMSDSVYGSSFFLATGFHGAHVMVGTVFNLVILMRHGMFHFSSGHHFGFEASAWYWHFVDVVWLFLFLSIYWWAF